MILRALAVLPVLTLSALAEPVLDARRLLEAQTFWDNRDFSWFEANIPFLDTPDAEINTTYYYRWELVTKQLTYGSPDTGYLWTEFINRPFWSGAYGAISCPSGLQFNETRWMRDPRFSRDYLRYWFRTPGAEPLRYSDWLADSAWGVHQVHPDKAFLLDLLPDLKAHVKGWEARSWVPEEGMFWQVGHDDGMEFNIASRQTQNILSGAPSYRPSFNAYLWADLTALGKMSALAGDDAAAQQYTARAAELKTQIQTRLWDPARQFFFPMFRDDETDKEGNTVKKNTLVYQSGKFAGSPHGRELAGYVPWYFNLPDPGFEGAWKFLTDPDYFECRYGPSTVERNDPLFYLSPSCCWWSGQSWPFATTQTLKAMANVLQNYPPAGVSREDYGALLHRYAAYQRKDGKPYIAEALHPDTGSWEGHDGYYRSEHYFHSGFVDLVITGLIGLKAEDGETLTVDPLAPAAWDYFAMDRIPWRGHLVSIVWDRTGDRYGRGAGFQVLLDGEKAASSQTRGRLSIPVPAVRPEPRDAAVYVNHAVNNDGNYYPRLAASHTGPRSALAFLQDGNTAWYHLDPPIRWTCEGSFTDSDWIVMELGRPRRLDQVKLFLLDDGPDHPVAAPASFTLESASGDGAWVPVPAQVRTPASPAGRMANVIRFPELTTDRLRLVFTHQPGKKSGLTEWEAWGPAEKPYAVAPPPAGNFAFHAAGTDGYPKASASFSDRFGGLPERAIDGRIIYRATPANRWTCYGSPNASDWLEVDFGEARAAGRVVLHLYDDGGGVQAPRSYRVETWDGSTWQEAPAQKFDPEKPAGSAVNTVTFPAISTTKLRVVFTHIGRGDTRSGVSEMEVWEK